MEDPGGREETPPNIELEFRRFDEKGYAFCVNPLGPYPINLIIIIKSNKKTTRVSSIVSPSPSP